MELAQVDVAMPQASLDAAVMAGFVKAVDDVNWLADKSAGFLWRLPPKHGPVTFGQLSDERVIVTVSVWIHFEALQHDVYRTGHASSCHAARDGSCRSAGSRRPDLPLVRAAVRGRRAARPPSPWWPGSRAARRGSNTRWRLAAQLRRLNL